MNTHNTFAKFLKSRQWIIWLAAASFYAFQYILRVSPNVMMDNVMEKFAIDAFAFGAISAVYYLGYSGLHVGVGLCLDRFQPRYVLSSSVLLCVVGVLVFAAASHWAVGLAGRFLIGAGSSASFLGAIKMIEQEFSRKQYGVMVGLTMTLGITGALYGGLPVSYLVDAMGFEAVFYLLAFCGVMMAVVLYKFIPLKPERSVTTKLSKNKDEAEVPFWQGVRVLISNPLILWIGVLAGFLVGPVEGFADAWGANYLIQVHGMTKGSAAFATSFIFVGLGLGSPFMGYVCERFGHHFHFAAGAGIAMALLFVPLLWATTLYYPLVLMIMFLIGALSAYQIILFASLVQWVDRRFIAFATACVNALMMSFGFVFHLMIGGILDWLHGDFPDLGAHHYDHYIFACALGVIPLFLCLGAGGFYRLTRYKPGQGKMSSALNALNKRS